MLFERPYKVKYPVSRRSDVMFCWKFLLKLLPTGARNQVAPVNANDW